MSRLKPSFEAAAIISSVITSVGSPLPKSSQKSVLTGRPSGAKCASYIGLIVKSRSSAPSANSRANSAQVSNLCISVLSIISLIKQHLRRVYDNYNTRRRARRASGLTGVPRAV